MQSEEIRRRFLDFFKDRGHIILPGASLVPENDPTVLFITAGMQPLTPYLMGRPHPAGRRLANVQKCVRTQDIDDVGDATHDTFFEMLGNWSLGDYFKKEAIEWSYELLTNQKFGFGFDPARLYITVYAGDDKTLRDEEAARLWRTVGIPAKRIYYLGADSNWWPNVKGEDTWIGPTGPSSEMFYDLTPAGLGDLTHKEFLKADEDQRVVEIWNDVFMTYEKKTGRIVGELSHKNVDTGAGLERLAMALQKKDNIFDTDLFAGLMKKIDQLAAGGDIRARRIVADHLRTATFIISDGVVPSNTDRGYVLRRLIRRAARYADKLLIPAGHLGSLADPVVEKYGALYPDLVKESVKITEEIGREEARFRDTLSRGLREFNWRARTILTGKTEKPELPASVVFELATAHGFPFELIKEMAREKGMIVDEQQFRNRMEAHRLKSRAGVKQKFKGGLADTGEMSVKYHTATHLLHQALREVLGETTAQKGSNITPERLRFDFAFGRKLTDDEKRAVEALVNQKIAEDLPVKDIVLPRDEAEKTGARHFFGEKYGDQVSVYFIGSSLDSAWSKEFCGGPHVRRTGVLGHFKIAKEEAVAAGTRRIKAVLE